MANKQKSDLSRAFSEDGELKTHVGGQALLEGIMMRGKFNWAVAVREPDGVIYTEEHDLASGKKKNSWLYWPFIRGCRAFVESLTLGYKALEIAAAHAFMEEGETPPDAQEDGSQPCIQEGESQPALDEDARSDAPAQAQSPVQTQAQAPTAAPDTSTFFSWKRDFGNPDEMIDGLAAQRTLEVIDGDTGLPVVFEDETSVSGSQAGEVADERSDAIENTALKSDSGPADNTLDTANASDTAATEKEPILSGGAMMVSMVLGLVMGVALFVVAPAFVTNLIVGEYDDRTLLWNIVDGILRIGIFVFYIWLIGRMSDIKRMFGYHGAEHKTIHCFEHGLPLTPENARSFPRLHVRCGTAFLIMVMIIAIFVYTITPVGALIDAWGVPDGPAKLALVIVVRILLMPVIAGIAYEITVKWAGSHPNNPLVKVILWPGMQMQYLTTREPDDGQIECAIEAMKIVLEREQHESIEDPVVACAN